MKDLKYPKIKWNKSVPVPGVVAFIPSNFPCDTHYHDSFRYCNQNLLCTIITPDTGVAVIVK